MHLTGAKQVVFPNKYTQIQKSNRSLLVSPGLTVTACTEPSTVETINIAVNSDHPYSRYTRKLSQARVLQSAEPGNCTDIAFTKKAELEKQGIHSTMFACKLESGQGHAFLLLDDGRVLD